MTMKRNAKKQLTWDSKGAVRPITNPVRLGANLRAGGDGFESGFEIIARRKARSIPAGEERARITRVTRQAKRRLGYVRTV